MTDSVDRPNDRILVVDDNTSIQSDFARLLARSDESTSLDELESLVLGGDRPAPARSTRTYQLTAAMQGEEALEYVIEAKSAGKPYALAFVDMRMPPGWDGIQTIERFWQVDPEILCVICTAYSDHTWEEMVERLGDTDRFLILKKPFDVVELQQLAGALTTRWSLARQATIKRDELESLVEARTAVIAQQRDELASHQAYLAREQETAEQIFSHLMRRGDLELSVFRRLAIPAETFSGDLVLALRKPNGGINLMVGDFTGHGLAGALGALPASELFYRMTDEDRSIDAIIPEINQQLLDLLPTGMFLAACFVEISERGEFCGVWNGGLPDALFCALEGEGITHRFASRNLPLGVVGNAELDTRLEIRPIRYGDRLILVTDGVAETCDDTGQIFGQHRVDKLVEDSLAGEDLVKQMHDALDGFRGSKAQVDDVTLVEFTLDASLVDPNLPDRSTD